MVKLEMKKLYILFIFFLLSNSMYSQSQQWLKYSINQGAGRTVVEGNFIWIATFNGLIKLNTTTWEKITYQSGSSGLPDNSNSDLQGNFVDRINFDKDGNIWMICEGITKFDGSNWTNYNSSNSGLPDNWIYSFAIDSQDRKWIGTYDYGVAKFDSSGWIVYDMGNSELPSNWIYSIAIDDSDNAWFGAWGGGLVKFDGESWTVFNTTNSGLPHDSILCIAIDNNENIWMGTESGLSKFDGIEWTLFNTSNSGLLNNLVVSITIDSNGTKWISTPSGLSAYNEDGIVSVEKDMNFTIPAEYILSQNYPNPFNPNTVISYQLPENNYVQISIFDALGREISELVNDYQARGYYEINFDGSGLPSGMYLYRINAGKFSDVKKMLLLK